MLIALSVLLLVVEIFFVANDICISMGGEQAANGPSNFLRDDVLDIAGSTVNRLDRIVSECCHIYARGGIVVTDDLIFDVHAILCFVQLLLEPINPQRLLLLLRYK